MVRLTVISVDDGLLRTSTGCTGPAFSLTLYIDWSKLIVATIEYVLLYQVVCALTLTSRVNNMTGSTFSITWCSIFC